VVFPKGKKIVNKKINIIKESNIENKSEILQTRSTVTFLLTFTYVRLNPM